MVRASMTGNSHEVVKGNQTNDIVAGKGNGLIMLFHGSPGTGKTLTAGEQNSACM
jgi:DNA polymerase III delta prime subunit